SFYVNYESLKKTDDGFRGEKIGCVQTAHPLPDLPEGQAHYSNPRVSYDGKHWYLSVGIEVPEEKAELTSTVLGIDLGIKVLAYLSDGSFYENINKSQWVRKLQRRLLREQRRLSRKEQANIDHYEDVIGKDGKTLRKPVYKRPLQECRNYQKQKRIVASVHKKLKDLRTDYVHKVTRDIIDTLPKAIVMEDLKVANMMKNHTLAKAVSEQMWSEFRRQIEYKARMKGIEVVFADLFFPSSKTCSNCGNINRDLQLKDRIYVCPVCG
ncbi:transposase, partial [Erysipelotrichaceae bacterium NYU-BL-E8]